METIGKQPLSRITKILNQLRHLIELLRVPIEGLHQRLKERNSEGSNVVRRVRGLRASIRTQQDRALLGAVLREQKKEKPQQLSPVLENRYRLNGPGLEAIRFT